MLRQGVYRLEGPAKVTVHEGEIYATGVVYREGQSFTVLRARRLAIKALTDSKVELVLGPGALLERVDSSEEVVDEWERVASSLDPKGVVLILGAMDVGKSTMAALLGNKALARGYRVVVVDADVGQNDLGPPTTVSLSRLTRYVTHLRQLSAEKSIFLQSTSLERVWRRALGRITKAVRYALEAWGAESVIVNTDGWIADEEAVAFKRALIEGLKPSWIVAIQAERELAPILDGVPNVVSTCPPPAARAKSREDRKIHREMGYGRYIFPPVELAVSLERVPLCNVPLFGGVELAEELRRALAKALSVPVLYANQVGNRLYAVVAGDWIVKRMGGVKVYGIPEGFERGLLVGLEDGEGFLVGLGALKKIYYDRRRAIVYVSGGLERRLGDVACMRLGLVRLDESFMEAERVNQVLRLEEDF